MPSAGEPENPVPWGVVGAVALLFVLILAAGALFYHSQEQQITDSVSSELSSIALLKADQIAEWRFERLGDAAVLSQNRLFIDGVREYLSSPDPARQQKILTLFGQINTSYRYRNVLLVDPEGRVKASLDPTASQISPWLGEALAESLATHNATLTDLTPGTNNGSPRMYAIAPLIVMENARTDIVGAVILTIDPATDLYPLVQSWPVPSASAETLLVRREGDHVVYLNELRHQQNTALNLTIPLSRTDLPAVRAVQGSTGAFTGRDYRGIEVISALEPVRGSSWFMVAKVDREEALSSWRDRSGLITVLVAGTLIGAVVLVGLFWQRRQKYYYRSLYATEAAQRKEAEKNRERLEVLLKLGGMDTAGEQELADFVLDAGCRLTDSSLAFIGVMSPDESVFDITSWSKPVMKDCLVAASPIHFPVAKAGIWAEAIRQRKPLMVNDYAAPQPGKKGLPGGHVPVIRFASVPIFENQRIVMVCAVANKVTEYSELDVDNLVLLLQGVWSHIRKRKADDALRQKTTDLEAAFEEITATDEELRANYEEIAATQKALAESERKYRNLYHYAQVGLFETSFKDGTVVACNQQYANMAGFASVEDAIGKDILPLYENPDDRTEVGRILREKGFIENHTVRFRNRSTGKLFWGQFSARFNYEREVAEGTIIDITVQKEAQEALIRSEDKYRILFTRMIEGSALHEIVYDDSGNAVDYRILDVNPAFESTLGIRRETVVGKSSREAYGVDSPPYLETYARVAATGRPEIFDVYFAPMKKHFSISAYSPAKGKFATIFEDITVRKEAEAFRERLIRELEQKNAELERFTYTVSHDLKSPLITIKGFAGLLEDDASKCDPVQLKKDVNRIITAADTMQELLADVLELARIGRVAGPPEKILFGTIAREAVELLGGPLAERGVWVDIAPDLPVVRVDHARIREALVNLVENAIKFLGSQQNPVIRIGVKTEGTTPVFFVQDNGIGIDPRYLERIFNLFERLEVSTPGTGIGLPIVRRIIETHGGRIWAESEGIGKGTTFRFTLPGGTDGGEDTS